MTETVPPARGVRVPWSEVPDSVRTAIEERLGAAVVEAVTANGGFSPAVAAALLLADGTRAFVKAVGPEPNPDTPHMYRQEARIAAALPPDAPTPRLLSSFEVDGWVTLLFEYVHGRPPAEPWDVDELRRVLDAVNDLAAALTPSPIVAPSVQERLGETFQGWRHMEWAAESDGPGRLRGLAEMSPWAMAHLDQLAELESSWEEVAAGDTLLHCDLRADNLLLTPDRVIVVDWPWACVGAAWFDLVGMVPSIRMQGGPEPGQIVAAHALTAGLAPGLITPVVAALAGYFVWHSLLPPPPGLPTVRAFQAAQARVTLAWLERLTGW